MDRQGKAKLKEVTGERLKKANALIIAEYRGMKVEQLTQLRVALRKAKAEFRVSKNRIVKRAIAEDAPEFAIIADKLKGPVGTVICYGDVAAAAKAVLEFNKDNEIFVVRTGAYEGEALDSDRLKWLSDLPSKEVLLARMLGSISAPSRGLVTVLSGVPRNVVQVLAAIRDKKQG